MDYSLKQIEGTLFYVNDVMIDLYNSTTDMLDSLNGNGLDYIANGLENGIGSISGPNMESKHAVYSYLEEDVMKASDELESISSILYELLTKLTTLKDSVHEALQDVDKIKS